MSRLDDLIDLIQTTNEVYFITAPGRVRTAFILVDDIIELALKTFLQEKALEQREQCIQAFKQARWVSNDRQQRSLVRYFKEEIDDNAVCISLGHNPQTNTDAITDFQNLIAPFPLIRHWSVNNPDARNTFDSVIDEVKPFFPPRPDGSPHPVIALLDDALHRHQLRNRLYHDHQQSGLSIEDYQCLTALCSMFDLMGELFPSFLPHLRQPKYKVVRVQIGVLSLKLVAHGANNLKEPYSRALEQFEKHQLTKWSDNFEHSVLHTISENFFFALREQLRESIARLQQRIEKIDNMRNPNASQRSERDMKQREANVLQQQLADVEALMDS